MPLSLDELASEVKPLCIPFSSDKILVEYRPNVYTPELDEKLTNATADELKSGPLVQQILAVIASWDLELKKGVPLPLNAKGLQKVPYRVMNAIMMAVLEDMSPPKNLSGGSFGG